MALAMLNIQEGKNAIYVSLYGIGNVKHKGRKKCNIDCIISFGYISQIGKNIQISTVLFPLDIFHKLSRNCD